MTAPKTHLAITSATGVQSACGRGSRMDTSTFRVDCNSCITRNVFQQEHQKAVMAKEAAFQAQVPSQVSEPWRDGLMVCRKCSGDLFRYRGRSCYGHYDDHVCAGCGHMESRLTETGRCF